mgnify:FL=1
MTNTRLLKNAKLEYCQVNQNKMYAFSSSHTLSIYPIDAVYTFIPKNACSSLRYSIAVANGFIGGVEDAKWIHKNNQTFVSTQREVCIANYTFVVLRCPFTRIASSFLNILVDKTFNIKDAEGNHVDINFHDFLMTIKSQQRGEMDQHWRNQSDFLHYERYDEYFSLESFPNAIKSLGNHGLKVYDTRTKLKHDLSTLERIDGDFSKLKTDELKNMKDEGCLPNYKSMFGDKEIELINEMYKDDINLYKSHFGKNDLLF